MFWFGILYLDCIGEVCLFGKDRERNNPYVRGCMIEENQSEVYSVYWCIELCCIRHMKAGKCESFLGRVHVFDLCIPFVSHTNTSQSNKIIQ